MTSHRRLRTIVGAGLLIGGLVFVVLPYLWILLTAFKRPVDAAAVPPKLFSPITFSNWEKLLSGPFPESLGASALRIASAWRVRSSRPSVPSPW